MKLTLLLFSTVLSTSAAATQVYQWKDADGGVHYGQERPRDMQARRVTLTHDGESSGEAKARLDRLLEAANLSPGALAKTEQQQGAASAEAATRKAAEIERRRECVTAAHGLAKLENWAKRLLITDDSGSVTQMTNDQRSAAITRVRKWMSENRCT